MRLTSWLGSEIDVPHLTFDFGTVPNLFFYIDYIPRVDLWTNVDYVERYYEPINSTYLSLHENPELSLFVSKGLYIRLIQSPTHVCYTCPSSEQSLELIRSVSHEMCDRCLNWVENAQRVPEEKQAELALRDAQMRRISAERDPGNSMAKLLLGEELANQLVRALWDSSQR